jgi:hypothetical protein
MSPGNMLNGFFLKIQKNVSWGQKAKNSFILRKMAFGSHVTGPMSNLIAK